MCSSLQRVGGPWTVLLILLVLAAAMCPIGLRAQAPASPRLEINLAAGVPQYIGNSGTTSIEPQSQWWYENTSNQTTYSSQSFVESTDTKATWTQVGLPYDANIPRTFINQTSGGGQGSLTGTNNWYRLHFKVATKYAGQKFMLSLEGAHTGVQVYFNGTLIPGISEVALDSQATHVVGFVPVIVELPVVADGATDNVIAIYVARNSSAFESVGFCEVFRFGQAMAGLFRNVYMYVTNPVHIPVNIYSNQATWGTYVATMSETPAVASGPTASSAVVAVQTNVVNESGATVNNVTLTTQIVDEQGNVVAQQTAPAVSVPAWKMPTGPQPLLPSVTDPSQLTTATLPAPTFSQSITVNNPTLWFPNNSPFGKPYMYKVFHILSVGGTVVDAVSSPLGIRTITWDTNFPYFNGVQMHLWGGSSRYDYPALGSSVPDEIWWRDLAQFAAAGGNVWRPGHCSQSGEFLEAADAYGVMVDQPSGDGESHWTAANSAKYPDDVPLKEEIHRDMVIYDRNHPSILDWETDNGGMNWPLVGVLKSIDGYWDSLVSANSPLVNPVAANRTSGLGVAYPVLTAPNVRYEGSRGYDGSTSPPSAYGYLDLCDGAGCETGQKHSYPNNPAFGAEYWTNKGNGRGLNYDYELAFAGPAMNPWAQARAADTFGMAHWYFADTPGETCTWLEYANFEYPVGTPVSMSNYVRSLGLSMVDQNRFPRLQYYVYQANWVPYALKPVVHLAHHWNRSYQTNPIQENAFSNCPAVRLLINGAAKDPVTGLALEDQVPNDWEGYSGASGKTDMTQSTITLPGQVHWMVNWIAGTVTAQCLDGVNGNPVSGVSDTRTTFGAEYKIVLTALPEVIRPDGTSFAWTANGSDAALVQAEVQDAAGNLVYTAADNVTFSINYPDVATYMGGTQQLFYDPAWGATYYQDAFSNARTTVIGGEPNAFFHAPGDPELNFEGGLQKIALRSTITPGTVTVTATAPGLQTGSVTLTSVAPGTVVSCNAVPAAPTGVTAVGVSDSTITVTWAPVTPPANCSITSYSVYRDGSGTPVATGLTSTTYTDTGLAASSTHTYTVEAIDTDGASAQSSPAASGKTLAACGAVPPALTGLAGTPSSNSISLSWNAVSLPTGCTLQNYVVYSVSSSTPPVYTAVSPVSGSGAVTSTGYAVTGLTPLTNYTYAVTAVDEKGASAYSTPPVTVETTAVQSCTGLPNTPEAVLATANSSSQITVTWGTTTATGCTVYATVLRATASTGPYTQIATGIPAATTLQYVNTGLAPATTYYYEVEAYDTVGTTDPSAWTSAETLPASSSSDIVAIAAGGPAESDASGGDANFVADEDFTGGSNNTHTTHTIVLTQPGTNAAPMAVYQYGRVGATTYTIPGLVAGTQYSVLLHFSENYFSVAGKRQFNVAINGTAVLTNFDIYKTAGAEYTALVESFTTTANSSGQIVIALTNGSANQPLIMGIEIRGAAPTCSAVPPAPTGLAVTATTSGSVSLSWTAPTPPANCTVSSYVLDDGTASPPTKVSASGATGTTYTVTGLAASTTYYFSVAAVDAYGTSAASAIISDKTSAASCTAVTPAPTGLAVTATTSSSVSLSWTAPTPPANCTASSYVVDDGTASPPTVVAASGVTGTTYTVSGLAASTTYYFSVAAVDADGTSPASAIISDKTSASGTGTDFIAIDCAGPGASNASGGDATFVADVDFSGGGSTTTTKSISVTAAGANAAPMEVYQNGRAGASTYTIPGMVAGSSHTVLLHFSENYWSATKKREFNVAINGTAVLTNFDVYATAGAQYTAVVKTFTATANSSGQIVIAFTKGADDQALIDGIEIR